MASTTKYANYDSVLDNIISTVRRSYFGKTVNDKFLKDLKFLMKNKMKPRLMKPAPVPVKSVLNTEFDCLPLPNEILVKIFGYLDIQDIRCSAQVSHQFNVISKDSSLLRSEKLSIYGIKVPTEFLTYIIQRGITGISLFRCEILPPRVKLTELKRPLNLKTLSLYKTIGDGTLLKNILVSHPMEQVHLDFLPKINEETKKIVIWSLPDEYQNYWGFS